LLDKHGDLSRTIVEGDRSGACVSTYRKHFGTLANAFQRIDFVYVRKPPRRERKYTDKYLLNTLRRLLKKRRQLSGPIIAAAPEVASPGTYAARFGSLSETYRLVGYNPKRVHTRPSLRGISNADMLDLLARLWKTRGRLSRSIIEECKTLPSHFAYDRRFGGLMGAYKLIGYLPNDDRQRPRSPSPSP
jgi:hypothetical protein